MLGSPAGAEEAQHRVEFLCSRFSALFAQLHREEAELRAVESRNHDLERRLSELRLLETQKGPQVRAEVDWRHAAETAELRREVEAAERRLALGGGEADALAAAASAYARQAERLRERCQDEVAREQDAAFAFNRRAEELGELKQQRSELNAELEGATVGKARVEEELRLVTQSTAQSCHDIALLEQRLQDERQRGDASEADVQRKREDLFDIDRKLMQTQADVEELGVRYEAERIEGRSRDEQVAAQLERCTRCDDEVRLLTVQLEERRREGHESQLRLSEQTRQIHQLRERLKVEQGLQQQEQQASDATHARLTHVRAELPAAEKALQVSEAELVHLQKHSSELEERCVAQSHWRDELRQKASSSETALTRLREELRILTADRSKLQQELDEVTADKTRVEVEVEVATPALQDARRRCLELEKHLGERVRELGVEVDKTRRYRSEVINAHGKLSQLERHNSSLSARLWEQRSFQRQQCPEPLPPPSQSPRAHASFSRPPPSPRADVPHHLTHPSEPREQTASMRLGDSIRPRMPPSPSAPSPAPPSLAQGYYTATQLASSRGLGGIGSGSASPLYADQVRRTTSIFDRIDTNKDGVIDRRELDNALRSGELSPVRSGGLSRTSNSMTNALTGTFGSSGEVHSMLSPSRRIAMEAASLPTADAVRFLCDFVAKEEERLGLGSLPSSSPALRPVTPPPARRVAPRTPSSLAPPPVMPVMGR